MGQPKGDLKAILSGEVQQSVPEPEVEKPIPKPRCPSREGKTLVSAHIEPDAHYQLKLLSLEERKSIQQLVIEGINAVFKLHDKPPIA